MVQGSEVLLSEIRLQLWGRVGSWLARCCASRGKNAGWRLAPCVQHLVVPTNSGCCRALRCSSGTSHVVVCELASSSAGRPVEEIQRQGNLGKHQYFTYLFVFPNSKPIFTPNSNNCNNNNNLKPSVKALYRVSFLIGRLHMQLNIKKHLRNIHWILTKHHYQKGINTKNNQNVINKQPLIVIINMSAVLTIKTPFILLPLGSSPPGTYKMCLNALGTIFFPNILWAGTTRGLCSTNQCNEPHFFFVPRYVMWHNSACKWRNKSIHFI